MCYIQPILHDDTDAVTKYIVKITYIVKYTYYKNITFRFSTLNVDQTSKSNIQQSSASLTWHA